MERYVMPVYQHCNLLVLRQAGMVLPDTFDVAEPRWRSTRSAGGDCGIETCSDGAMPSRQRQAGTYDCAF